MSRSILKPLSISVLIIAIIAFVLVTMLQIDDATRTEQTTAVYKGYMLNGKHYNPIVEIDGKEYIANSTQCVRDNSYIGHEVIIKYDKTNLRNFKIIWDETELSEQS